MRISVATAMLEVELPKALGEIGELWPHMKEHADFLLRWLAGDSRGFESEEDMVLEYHALLTVIDERVRPCPAAEGFLLASDSIHSIRYAHMLASWPVLDEPTKAKLAVECVDALDHLRKVLERTREERARGRAPRLYRGPA